MNQKKYPHRYAHAAELLAADPQVTALRLSMEIDSSEGFAEMVLRGLKIGMTAVEFYSTFDAKGGRP